MFKMPLVYVKAPAWSGYHREFLPQRMALVDVKAADAFNKVTVASEGRITYTDIYRSAQLQADSIRAAVKADTGKARLYAPVSESGHNFGMSFDVAIDDSLARLKQSENPELREAGKSRDALAAWLKPHGWTGIHSETWHFDFLDGRHLILDRINEAYGTWFQLTDAQLQDALDEFLGLQLKPDGILGAVTQKAVTQAREKLCITQGAGADAFFRRVLACACINVDIIKNAASPLA